MVTFIGTCVDLRVRDLNAYDDSARDITYRTFRKHVGGEVIDEIHQQTGGVPHISQDYGVTFSRGRWKGRPAACMMHSSIHHLWYI